MSVRPILVSAAALALTACATARPGSSPAIATASLSRADGAVVGTAVVRPARGGTLLQVSASGLTPGLHGIHLHAVGKCETPDFTSAGGHLNPTGRQHGTLNPAGSHLGDLPNLEAGSDGTALLEFRVDHAPAMVRSGLFDADGTSIVIHAGPDDYRTDPSGNSGGRVACGVLSPG